MYWVQLFGAGSAGVKTAEKEFVDGGHADEDGRLDVMYNDFVVLGPKSDPAGIEKDAKEDALKAFKTIAKEKQTFVSRADDSLSLIHI